MTPSAISQLAPVEAPSLSVDNPAVADVTLDSFLLDGRPMDAQIVEALDDVGLRRAIDGASTITASVDDPRRELLNSPALKKAPDLWLDDLVFRLAGIDYDEEEGPHLDLTFEARAVARLRTFDEPKAAKRKHVTRAEFIKSLCDEAGVPFVCPQLHKRQKIAKPQDAPTQRQKDRQREPHIKQSAALTVKTVPADSGQIRLMNRVLDVARSHKAGDRAALALLEACIQESTFRNLSYGDSTSTGILQVLASTAAGMGINPRDVEACAAAFLTRGFFGRGGAMQIATRHPDWTPGQIAQAVQGSAHPDRYEVWRKEADKILAAYTGGTGGINDTGGEDTYAVAYMFRRGTEDGRREDSWTCMRRLADEVNWRLWEDAGTVFLMTDADILRSRVRHTITPGAQGIDNVSFRLDVGKRVQEVTVQCQARRWQAPPGTVCEVEGYGPADGRWIVATIDRPSLFATDTTITLHRREKPRLEPAPELRTRQRADSGVEVIGNGVAGGTLRGRVVAAAKHAADLSKSDPSYYHYSQPGRWKNDLFKRDAPGERSDCSAFVIQVYAKAGCKLPASLHGQGFTGTLADEGRKVTKPKPGDIVLYGTYPYRHVELYVGDGQTIGHGDRFVNYSTPRGPSGFAGYWTFDFLDDDDAAHHRRRAAQRPSTGRIPGIGNVGAD